MDVTYASKAEIVEILRSRGKGARADWFDRQLPDMVDTAKNRSLLASLGIDPDDLIPVESSP